MPHDLDPILTLTGGLAAALALGYVTQQLALSPIVGYPLAGIVVGPDTPRLVADRHQAEQLAELGVILLMFGRSDGTRPPCASSRPFVRPARWPSRAKERWASP